MLDGYDIQRLQLDIIPAQIRVIRHIFKQYACQCGQCIRTAPLQAQPIPKSLASPGLPAHVTVSKYQDALPLYRQETILQRMGVDIPRATLANGMIKADILVQPIIDLLRDRLLNYDIIQMNETRVPVLKGPGKPDQYRQQQAIPILAGSKSISDTTGYYHRKDAALLAQRVA